jgi:hypothetical protein
MQSPFFRPAFKKAPANRLVRSLNALYVHRPSCEMIAVLAGYLLAVIFRSFPRFIACRLKGSGFWVLGCGFWVVGSGLWVQGSGLWVQGSGFKVLGCGFRVQGSGLRFRVQGLEVQDSVFSAAAGKRVASQIEKETLKKRITNIEQGIMNLEVRYSIYLY